MKKLSEKENEEINFIKAKIVNFYKNINKEIKNFHLEEIEKINIKNISNFHWWFRARFFYWIFDFKSQKGWIRFHWTNTKEFLIKSSLVEKWFFDVNIWSLKWVFASDENSKKWQWIIYKKEKFNNYSRDCLSIEVLINKLLSIWFSFELLKNIFNIKTTDIFWTLPVTTFFYTQLKILKEIRKRDKDIIKYKIDNYHYNHSSFELNFWQNIKERLDFKYNLTLKYLWKENKVLLYLNFSNEVESYLKLLKWNENSSILKNEIEKIGLKWNDFIKELNKISNIKNVNFIERAKVMKKYFNL